VLDHVGIQVRSLEASKAFYDVALAPLGARRMLKYEQAVGYGVTRADFWLYPAVAEEPGREVHLAFTAADRDTVWGFFAAAVAAGAEVLHEPRVWPEYHESYFGAFVRDPDGNNVEAVCHAPE
jgi:catechol 2,3-dioxygenase-like lactoylglutathione lyase family enzyme